MSALGGAHALDRLHTAASAAGAVGKTLYSVGKFLVEVCDEAGNGAHRVPQQGGVGGVMNVGFHHRGVDAESLAVFQPQLDSRLDHELIDITKRLRRKSVEGAVERILLGDGLAVKLGKAAQREAIVDALLQFAIIPVLDAHENQRAEHLRGSDAVASGAGVLQASLQILAHLLDEGKRSEEHTSELQSRLHLVCRLLLEKKKQIEEPYIPC